MIEFDFDVFCPAYGLRVASSPRERGTVLPSLTYARFAKPQKTSIMPSGSKYYCFTINNPTGILCPDELRAGGVSYAIWSEEVGDSGTYHYQGYLETTRRKTITALKKIPGLERAHFEQRRGTSDEAIAYCSKIDDPSFIDGPYTFGTRSTVKQGQRSDLSRIQQQLMDGASLAQVATDNFSQFIRYHRGITEYQRLVHPQAEEKLFDITQFNRARLDLTRPVLLWGEGGTGKTEFALAHFERPLLVRHIDALRDLRPGFHDGLVFDDMDFSHWPHGSRVHILDMNRPSQIHCRYSHAVIPRNMPRIFCANSCLILHRDSDTPQQRSAVERRLLIVEIVEPLFSTGGILNSTSGNMDDEPSTNGTNQPPVFQTLSDFTNHMSRKLINLYTTATDYLSASSSPEPIFIDTGSNPTDLFP